MLTTPPHEEHTFLFNALAIEQAMLVLPTPENKKSIDNLLYLIVIPGGPTKHKIFPCTDLLSCDTAINSNILSFISVKP